MDRVRSEDGTAIAFDRVGDGPPIILASECRAPRTYERYKLECYDTPKREGATERA
jgi:hypothetical protein